jgi:predicted metal-binding protein
MEKYIKLALNMGADHAVAFTTDQIAFDSRTILKCMFGCTDWGYGHTCPSRKGSLMPWEYKNIFGEYKRGIIIHSTSKKISQEASFEVEKQAFLDGYYFAFSLSDCAICEKCAGLSGVECANPKKARPSFHSVGIDVFKTVHQFGLPLETLKTMEDQQNWYSAVFID